jgi:tetratricopeptide (TPR) repeat protein
MRALINSLIFMSLLTPSVSYSANVYLLDSDSEPTIANQNFDIDVMKKLLTAEIALDRRDVRTAVELYLQVSEQTQDSEISQRATDLAILFTDLDTALVPASIWADAEPNDLQAQATVAAIFLTQLKAQKSVPYLQRLQEIDPDNAPQNFQVLYDELRSRDEKDEVIRALELLMQKVPEAPGTYLSLSTIFLQENRPNEALKISEKALQQGMLDGSIPILHAQALHNLDRQPDALLFLSALADNQPQNTELQLYLTEVLVRVWNDTDQAKRQLDTFLEGKPSADELLASVILSIEYEWFGHAKHILNTLKDIPEQNDTAEYFLGRVAEFEGNHNKAILWYEDVASGQYQAIARLRMATLLSQQEKYSKALKAISQAKPVHPEDIKLLALIELEVLSKMDRYDEAFMRLSQALAKLPFDSDLLYIRALLAEKINNLEVAERDLRRIIRIYPNHVEALNALGYILANRTDRLIEAMAFVQQAMKLSPSNPGILDSFGWIHYKMGNHDKAEKALRQAWALSKQPLIAAHLGEVLFIQGKEEDAHQIWAQAQKNHPNDEILAEVIQRLMPEKAQAAMNDLDSE